MYIAGSRPFSFDWYMPYEDEIGEDVSDDGAELPTYVHDVADVSQGLETAEDQWQLVLQER